MSRRAAGTRSTARFPGEGGGVTQGSRSPVLASFAGSGIVHCYMEVTYCDVIIARRSKAASETALAVSCLVPKIEHEML
jgi:hypothetical protein